MNTAKSFPIEQSYINLALVETKEQEEKEKKLKRQKHDRQLEHEEELNDHRKQYSDDILSTFEDIYGTKTMIAVEKIFEKCKDQTKKVLVLGRAGIGKSTFCQYVTYRWAKGEIWREYQLVVLLRLRLLTHVRYPRRPKYSPIDLIEKEYVGGEKLSKEVRERFKDQCNKGQVLWILDGYDEFVQHIPQQLKDVFDQVLETQHHILTSRPYMVNLSYVVKMEITGFTNDNITKYVYQFFDQIKDKLDDASSEGQKLLQFLQSNPGIWGISHIPVNLELICSVWSDTDESKMRISTMTTLYDKITEWLCRRYLTRKEDNVETMSKKTIYRKCQKELQFLETLAFNAMEGNTIILAPELLKKTEEETQRFLGDYPQLLNIGILKTYENKATGTQIPTEKQHYFVHLSFQEHFAARHLVKTLQKSASHEVKTSENPDRQKADNFINRYKYNQRFILVFIFASGLLSQTEDKSCMDTFWSILQGKPQDLAGLKHMKLVIECIDELAGNPGFSQYQEYLKPITDWIEKCILQKPHIITEHLLQSLQRTTSLPNEPMIQEKLTELFRNTNPDIKYKILRILSKISIHKPLPEIVSTIRAALQTKDHNLNRSAIEAYQNLGKKLATKEVIDSLLNALHDENGKVRNNACYALEAMGEKAATKEVIDSLANALQDKVGEVRISACHALVAMGEKAATKEVIDSLLNVLHDESEWVRISACYALVAMGEKAATKEVIDSLANALRDEGGNVRSRARDALVAMGEKAATKEVIDSLVNALHDEDEWVRISACYALRALGKKAATKEVIDSLLNALHDEDDWVRENVCYALEAMGEKAATKEAIDSLLNALPGEDREVRISVCHALEKIGEKAATKEVIDSLANALHDEDREVRISACHALVAMGEKAATKEVIDSLANALQDEDREVRSRACDALEKMGEKAATKKVIDSLVNALQDEDKWVRSRAYDALVAMGEKAATKEVIDSLLNALQDEDREVRISACHALEKMGEKAATKEVIDSLANALQDKVGEVRISACHALEKMGEKAATKEVIDSLANALQDEDREVRSRAFDALKKMGEKAATKEVIDSLANALHDEDREMRSRAFNALKKMGEKAATKEVIDSLVNALHNEDRWVRRSACDALVAMGEKAATKEVIDSLVNALHDEDREVRRSVCDALKRMGEKAATKECFEELLTRIDAERSKMNWWDVRDFEKVLEVALCSYSGILCWNSRMLSKVFCFIEDSNTIELRRMPCEQFVKAYLETQNVNWLPLAKCGLLTQCSAVIVKDSSIVIYGSMEPSELHVGSTDLINKLVKTFKGKEELSEDIGMRRNSTGAETGSSRCCVVS